jgi:hypothetical protein
MPREGKLAWQDLVAVLIVVAACCLFFWRGVTLRGVFFHYDHAQQNYPYRLFFAEGLRRGRLPLWTSDVFCGFPLFAESQGNALYPPFLLLFGLFRPWVAYNLYTVLHFALAGLFAYIFARVMRIGRAGSALAGVVYMMAPPILSHPHHINIVVGICYLPLLLALLELTFRQRSSLPLVGFAAVTGLLALGAQPQYTLYAALVCGLFLLWRVRLIQLTGAARRTVVVLLVAVGLAGAVGGLLAGVQLLPLAGLVTHSSRAGAPMALRGVSPGVPGHLMTLMLPHYFGSAGLGSYWGNVDPGIQIELTLFVGTAPLILALVGALTDRSRRAFFFTSLGIFAFLFSLGVSGGLYNAFALLPLLGSARFAPRFAFVTALCVGMLAGMGLDQLLGSAQRARVRGAALVSGAGVLMLAVVCLAITGRVHAGLAGMSREQIAEAMPVSTFEAETLWRHLHQTLPADIWRLVLAAGGGTLLLFLCLQRRRRADPLERTADSRPVLAPAVAAVLWVGLTFAEFAWVGRELNPVTDPAVYTDPPPLARALKELPEGRIFRYRYYDRREPSYARGAYPFTRGWALEPDSYAACLDRLPHNANMIWGIPSVSGFCPLQTRTFKAIMGQPEAGSTLIEFQLTPTLDLLGARYVLTPGDEVPDGLEFLRKVGDISVLRNPRALPRAFLVHRAERAPGDDAVIEALLTEGFDYRESIFVHEPRRPLIRQEPGLADPDESALITADEGERIAVSARLARSGYLVLADHHYPGWRVEVDGRPAELLRVNAYLKGVRLAPGRHEVLFAFRPAGVRLGTLVTLAGVGLLVAGMVGCLIARGRLPAPGEAEDHALLERSPSRRMVLLVLGTALLLAALGPVLSPGTWRRVPHQLDPRKFAVHSGIVEAYYRVAEGRAEEAYDLLRELCRWWPENPDARARLVKVGDILVRRLAGEGRNEQARALAAEVATLAPEEVERWAPALRDLGAGAARGGRSGSP